ncbi:MAG: TonB-dependent receptor [Candidatus Dadabacteria bacterium]|nr:MAG: TonB-dependent receptor [Candidatus Dadabacteria bacterium]
MGPSRTVHSGKTQLTGAWTTAYRRNRQMYQRFNHFSTRTLFVLFGLLASIAAAQADDATDDAFSDFGELDLAALLDAPVESASGQRELISEAPAVIEVITADQIRAWGSSDLYEVLSHIAGIENIEDHWGRTLTNIRGSHAALFNNKILLLVDRYPVYEVGNMSSMLEEIPVSAIDRVEVIRGPAGVLYGTNAYAGVVHVITEDPKETSGSLSIGGGRMLSPEGALDDDPWDLEFRTRAAHTWDSGTLRLDVQGRKLPEWTAEAVDAVIGSTAPGQHADDAFLRDERRLSGLGRVTQHFGDHSLRLLGGYFIQKKYKWGFLPWVEIESRPSEMQDWYADARWQWTASPQSVVRASIGYQHNDQYNEAGTIPALASLGLTEEAVVTVDTNRLSLSLGADHTLADGDLTLQEGLDLAIHFFEDYAMTFRPSGQLAPGVPQLNFGANNYDLNAFVQAGWKPVERLSLLIGVRGNLFVPGQIDRNLPKPDPRFTPNPRASIVARLHDTLTAKLLYGRAFRVPSVFNMFVAAAGAIFGDPNLKAETVDTAELAFDYKPLEHLSLRLNGYVNVSNNDIVFAPHPNGIGVKYVNAEGTIARGVELTTRYLFRDLLDANASVGFQEASERDTGNYISNVPRLMGSIGATLRLLDGDLKLTPTTRIIGARGDFSGTALLDATLYYDPLDWFGIGLVARNLIDTVVKDVEPIRKETRGGVRQNQPRTLTLWLTARF